jgi:hypothetical protein
MTVIPQCPQITNDAQDDLTGFAFSAIADQPVWEIDFNLLTRDSERSWYDKRRKRCSWPEGWVRTWRASCVRAWVCRRSTS